MAGEPPNSLKEVRIDAEIGDDPAELDVIADAVVRGCSIRYARIKSLRGLIEAIQRHPDAKLAPPADKRGEDWKPPEWHAPDALTKLAIYGGEITEAEDCERLDIRVMLLLPTRFGGNARFNGASFGGEAWFFRTSFGRKAEFFQTSFGGKAEFYRTSFGGVAEFGGASFGGEARFVRASFGRKAVFYRASFGGYTSFLHASFGGGAEFNETSFGGYASFLHASFGGEARFAVARFGGGAEFNETSFGGEVSFYGASFGGVVRFGDTTLAGADFSKADLTAASFFRADVSGMNISGTKLIGARGLFGKGRAIARSAPIEEYAAQTAIYGQKYDLATWERLRIIGSLRLFGVSYLTIIAIVLYATFAKWYNPLAAHARETAKDTLDGAADAVPIWVNVLSRMPDLPLPEHLGWQLLATLTVAAAATIYAIFCPSEVQEQSEVRWTRAMNQPLWEYRSANWSRLVARYLCLALFLAGGAYSAYYIIWRTVIAIGYLFAGSA